MPIYSDADGERRITGDAKFTVTESDGHSATVSSETGGTYTMPKDSVKHFADDLNQKVDVPEHPSNHHVNAIREGRAKWLGKGDDGMVFDVGEGRVGKVTTTVPYNLQNHRAHHHAIADARRQAELTNQAISEGHDILLPQEFEEHGEKGFTFMPKVAIGGELSPDQIKEYRTKLKAFHDAGWRLNDRIQHGVDADGRIRIFDTGKLTKIDPTSSAAQHDDWGQAKHGRTLMREHGHFDEETHSDNVRDYLDDIREVLAYNDGVEQGERVNPLYPHEWRELNASIDELIANESDELGFHVDDLREALDRIEGQFPRTTPRGAAFTAKTNDPNADFWIQRKGGEDTVGTPHKDFRPESIGITVDSEQFLPDYAYYLFQHVQQNLGFWKQRATGTLNLKNITLRDVKELQQELQQQMRANEPPVPKGFELIAGLREKLDKYESETANRVLDNRLLNAQQAFEDMVTDYEQYEEDDLPHGESIDALIEDKNLFAEMIPDISDDELATLAFASYHTGPYRRSRGLNIAGFNVGEEELDWKTESGRVLMRLLDRQAKRGFNQNGQPVKIGEKNYNGIAYEPEQMQPHQYDEWLRNQYPETESFRSAGFIANDGTLLDLSGGSRDGQRSLDHRDAVMTDEAAERWGLKPDMGRDYSQYHKLMHILENANAIRFDAEAGLIDTRTMPTESQFRALAKYIGEYAPGIIYVDFNDTNFPIENPTIGELRRAFEAVGRGEDVDSYAADDGMDSSEPLRPSFNQRAGSEQKLQSPEDKGYQTPQQLEKQRESTETLIEPQHLEPYEHVEPEPIKVEPNVDARKQLQKIYSDAFGEELQDGSAIKQILLRNKEYAEAGQQALFPETSTEYLKSLDNDQISELHRQAYPKPERVNPFADDDYLYHVARSDSGSWIEKEGLKPNQSSNFGGGLQHNIRGNVFLTEKSGMPDVLNYLQRNLEASGQWDDDDNYDEPIYSKHFRVFRIPKKHIKDYAAIDEVGTRDQQSTAYKVNHVIKQRVKNAKQMAGKYQQAMSRSNYEAKNLKEQRDSLATLKRKQIGIASQQARKAERNMDDLLRQIERQEIPRPYELQFEISAPYEYDDGNGGTQMVRDLNSYFIDKTRANPQGEKKWFDALVIAAERGNFLDDDKLSDEQKRTALDNYGRHTLDGRYFSLENVYRNLADQRTDPEYMDQLYETQSDSWAEFKGKLTFLYRFNNAVGDIANESTTHTMQWMENYRDDLRYINENLFEFGDIGPYTQRAKEIANSATAAIDEAYTATSTLNDWQEQYGELYDYHLVESARMQLQDMKLKVASNPNYWEWNRNGVALDSNGLPLILFHGTPQGGFGQFARLDKDGHVYSSTDVTMGTSYNNGYYEDATPAFANTVDDVREAVSRSKKLFMDYIEPYGDIGSSYRLSNPETGTLAVMSREKLSGEIGDDTEIPQGSVISSGNDLELVVGWNKWLHDPSQQRQRGSDIQARGVYPLVYRLEKPLVIEANGNLWNDIDLFATIDRDYAESYASAVELLSQPQVLWWLGQGGGSVYSLAANELRSWVFSQGDRQAEAELESLDDRNPISDEFDSTEVNDERKLANLVDDIAAIYGVTAHEILQSIVALPYQLTTRDYAEAAEAAGYDGIIFKEIVDYGGAVEEYEDLDYEDYPPADVYVAFNLDQVKSAHNLGTFTREGPDATRLLYQATE